MMQDSRVGMNYTCVVQCIHLIQDRRVGMKYTCVGQCIHLMQDRRVGMNYTMHLHDEGWESRYEIYMCCTMQYAMYSAHFLVSWFLKVPAAYKVHLRDRLAETS